MLRFNNGLTSAGVSASAELASRLRLSEGASGWKRLLEHVPSVARQFDAARAVRDFTWVSSLPWRCSVAAGDRWALLPSAAGFVDPLLSTGFPLTLLGIERLAALLERGPVPGPGELEAYSSETLSDLDAAASLIGALHRNLGRPELFRPLSMLYFAAAIFSETVRRLGRPGETPGFLLRDRPSFAAGVAEVVHLANPSEPDGARVRAAVSRTVDPINLAGLDRSDRRNWYPVEVSDLYASAAKIPATREELAAMLRGCGFPG